MPVFVGFVILNTLFFYLTYTAATIEDFSSYFIINDSLTIVSIVYVIYVVALFISKNPFYKSKSYAAQLLFFLPLLSLAVILYLKIDIKRDFIFTSYILLLLLAIYRFIKYNGQYIDQKYTSDFKYFKNAKLIEFVYFVLIYAMIALFLVDKLLWSIVPLLLAIGFAIFSNRKKLKTKLDDFKYAGLVSVTIYAIMVLHVNVIFFSVV